MRLEDCWISGIERGNGRSRSTKSEKLYPSMLQRNGAEDAAAAAAAAGAIDGYALPPESVTGHAGAPVPAGGVGPVHSVSRSSLGNYSALLSLSRMASKEDDCKTIFGLFSLSFFSSVSLFLLTSVDFTHQSIMKPLLHQLSTEFLMNLFISLYISLTSSLPCASE